MLARGGVLSSVPVAAVMAALAAGPAAGQTATFARDASIAALAFPVHESLSPTAGTGAPKAGSATIAGIAFASPAGRHAIGEEILVSVAFDRPVAVTGEASVALDIGGTTRRAGYRGGGGTRALVFAYAVAEGDLDDDGIAVGADRLTAPAGSLSGPGGGAVTLAHPAVPADATRTVDACAPRRCSRRSMAGCWP